MRNPIVNVGGLDIQTIGDAHLGRVFKTNVPLHRRGEYENAQFEAFLNLLKSPTMIKIQVGDLLDKALVSTMVLIRIIEELQTFEQNGKLDKLYIISGNHDDSKSSTEPTSWDVLAKFFEGSFKINFVKKWVLIPANYSEQILLVGWNIYQGVAESFIKAKEVLNEDQNIIAVFCHLDRISYGDDHNVIPYDFLKSHNVKKVITGHEHKPFKFFEGDLEVIGTGSLLPYSHAEDPESNYYQTINFKDLDLSLADTYQDKHIRILVDEDDYAAALDLKMDCLSLQIKKLKFDQEVEQTQVEVQNYSAKALWQAAVNEANVLDTDTANELWLQIEEKGIEDD